MFNNRVPKTQKNIKEGESLLDKLQLNTEAQIAVQPTSPSQPLSKKLSDVGKNTPSSKNQLIEEAEKVSQQDNRSASSLLRQTVISQKESTKDQDQAESVYNDPDKKQWQDLHSEYQHENEKEVPAHLSVIIYQCLHPLQDAVQDDFTNMSSTGQHSDGQQNDFSHQQESLLQHQQENIFQAYEYLVILEHLTQPYTYNPSYEKSLDTIIDKNKNDLSERYLLVRKNLSDQEGGKEFPPISLKFSQEKIDEKSYEKLSLASNKLNLLIQEEEEDEKTEDNFIFEDHDMNFNSAPSSSVHCDYRNWIPPKKDKNESKAVEQSQRRTNSSGKNPEEKQESQQTRILRAFKDKYSSGRYQQFRLSMWRLDKKYLTKLIIAEQTIILEDNNLEVFNHKFCFSVDKNLIHITFKKGNKIEKTICFKSIDLDFAFEFDHSNLELVKRDNKDEEDNELSDPVMFFDPDLQHSYGIYFQDKDKGYFRYKNHSRNSQFYLKLDSEIITNVFFGINDLQSQMIIFSQVFENFEKSVPRNLKQFKIQLIPLNERELIQSQDQKSANYISLDPSLSGFIIQKALYHPRYGILLEEQTQGGIKKMIQITNFYLNKDNAIPRIFEIDDLTIPLNAQCQSKLSMKCKFRQVDYLFLFEDFIECKGSLKQLYDNGQLIRIPPRQSYIELHQLSDFIASLEKTATVHELTITDIKLISANKHMKTPSITFIAHNFLNNRQQIMPGYIQQQTNQRFSKLQMDALAIPEASDFQTFQSQAQNVHYNEPYIFEVVNQITLNVYCTLDPKKNYTYFLKNHFECFLEFQEEEFILPRQGKQEADGILYRHQICMMITYDLKAKCHRVEIFVMPSYHQMLQGQFKIITLPYKLDLQRAPGSIQNSLVTGHYHQLKQDVEKKEVSKLEEFKIYNAIILQFVEGITQFNLPGDRDEKSQQLLDFDQTSDRQFRNLKMIKTDITRGKLFENLKDNVKKENQKELKYGIRCYLMLTPYFNNQNLYKGYNLAFIGIGGYKDHPFTSFSQESQIFTQTSGKQIPEILHFSLLKDDDHGNLYILTVDDQFIVSKYQITYKKKNFLMILKDKTMPNESAENEWNRLSQSNDRQQQKFDFRFKNLNQREIVLTDEGLYFDTLFFQNIYESNKKQEISMLEFENIREKYVSKIFSEETEQPQIDLNISAAILSPDQTSLLFCLCRCKQSIDNAKSSQYQRRIPIQSFDSIRTQTSKVRNFQQNNHHRVVHYKESHKGFYFFSVPIVTNKHKQMMPLDSLNKKVEHSTFLGNFHDDNKDDDVLVKLESKFDSLGFLIFSRTGQVRILNNNIRQELRQSLQQFKVLQFLPCTKMRSHLLDTRAPLNLLSLASERNIIQEFQEIVKVKEDNERSPNIQLVMKILLAYKRSQNEQMNEYQILNISKEKDQYFIEAHFPTNQKINLSQNRLSQNLDPILKLYAKQQYESIHLMRLVFCANSDQHQDTFEYQGEKDYKFKNENDYFLYIDRQEEGAQGQNTSEEEEKEVKQVKKTTLKVEKKNVDLELNNERTTLNVKKTQDSSNHNKKRQLSLEDFIKESIGKFEKENRLEKNQQKQEIRKKRMSNEKLLLQTQNDQNLEHDFYKNGDFEILILPQLKQQRSYIIFRVKNKIYYALIENPQDQNNFEIVEKTQQKIQIKFREPGVITQLLHVQREDQLQIMYFEGTGNFYLLLWSLVRNQEISLQTFKTSIANPFYQVFKGTQMRDNYLIYIGSQFIQDLRLDFPQNFLSGKFAWNGFDIAKYEPKNQKIKFSFQDIQNLVLSDLKIYKDELKTTFSCSSKSLGLISYGQTQVQRSYSYIDLQYIKYLLDRFDPSKNMKEDSKNPLLLDKLSVYLPYQSNILHYFAINQHFLELFLKEIPSKEEINHQGSHLDSKLIFAYYPLMPNSLSLETINQNGRRPFSVALKKDNIPCLEVLIQILMCDPNKCYINSIKPYFKKLLEQKSLIVFEFLENHTTKFLYIETSIRKQDEKGFKIWFCNCIKNRNELQLSLNPSISQYYYNYQKKNQKQQKNYCWCWFCCCNKKNHLKSPLENLSDQERIERFIKQTKIERFINQTRKQIENETYSDEEYDSALLSFKNDKKKPKDTDKNQYHNSIQLYSYDFDGFLYGVKANEFLNFIIQNKDNIKVFDIKYIEMLITYQWKKSWCQYLLMEIIFNLVMFTNLGIIIFISQKLTCRNPNDIDECTSQIFDRFYKKSQFWDTTQYNLFWFLTIPLGIFLISRLLLSDNSKRRSKDTIVEYLLNFMYIVKIMLDASWIVGFRVQYLSYNLQAPAIQEDYWNMNDPQLRNSSLDQQYAIRYIYNWIFMIKAGNAVVFILLPLILIYRNRFYLDDYVPRLFLVVQKLSKVLIYFLAMTAILSFAYQVVLSLNYNSPNNSTDVQLIIDVSRVRSVDFISYTSDIYLYCMLLVISFIILIMFWFGGVAVAQEEKIAKKTLKADRLYNMAKKMFEGNFIYRKRRCSKKKWWNCCCKQIEKKCCNQKRFEKARYIIHSVQKQQVHVPED